MDPSNDFDSDLSFTLARRTTRVTGEGRAMANQTLELLVEESTDDSSFTPRRHTLHTYYGPHNPHVYASFAVPYQMLRSATVTQHAESSGAIATGTNYDDYDARGFPTVVNVAGRVDILGDELAIAMAWAHDAGNNVIGLPVQRTQTDAAGRWSNVRVYHDGSNLLADVCPSALSCGRPTRVEKRASDVTADIWTGYDYDAFGNLVEVRQSHADATIAAPDSVGEIVARMVIDPWLHQFPVAIDDGTDRVVELHYRGLNSGDDYPGSFGTLARQFTPATPHAPATRYRELVFDSWGRPWLDMARDASDDAVLSGVEHEHDHDASHGLLTVRSTAMAGAGSWRERTLDSLGRVIETARASDAATAYETAYGLEPSIRSTIVYGPYGTPYRVALPHRHGDVATWTAALVDGLGRTRKLIAPGRTFRNAYHPFTVERIDENHASSGRSVDGLGRTIEVWAVDGTVSRTDYPVAPNTPEVTTSPLGLQAHMWRDGFGRITATQDPDRDVDTRAYDARGNLSLISDAEGRMLRFRYDARDRLAGLDEGDDGSLEQRFYYDGATPQSPNAVTSREMGLRSAMTDDSGTTTWGYDLLGLASRVDKEVGGEHFTAEMSHDGLGRVTMAKYTAGGHEHAAHYSYGHEGLSTVDIQRDFAAPLEPIVEEVTLEPTGQLASMTFGNHTRLSNSYDAALRLSARRVHRVGSTSMHRSLRYDYDPTHDPAANVGALTAIIDEQDASKTQRFYYDDAYRLARADSALWGGQRHYSYDDDGNLRTKGAWSYSYDAGSNRLVHAANSITHETRGLLYDASGLVIDDDKRELFYDDFRRVSRMRNSSGDVTLQYDGLGRLVKRYIETSSGGRTLITPFDAIELETPSAGQAMVHFHVLAGGERIATRTVSAGGESLRYRATDHLGSTMLVSDETAQVVSESYFTPFGTPLDDTGAPTWSGWDAQSSMYVGVAAQDELELHLTGPRTYDAEIGRFLQTDALRVGRNPYQYAYNNPLSYADPSGFEPDDGLGWHETIPGGSTVFMPAVNVEARATIPPIQEHSEPIAIFPSNQLYPSNGYVWGNWFNFYDKPGWDIVAGDDLLAVSAEVFVKSIEAWAEGRIIPSITIVDHAAPGDFGRTFWLHSMTVGPKKIDGETIMALAFLGASLPEGGFVVFNGCKTALGEKGASLMDRVVQAMGKTAFMATDRTFAAMWPGASPTNKALAELADRDPRLDAALDLFGIYRAHGLSKKDWVMGVPTSQGVLQVPVGAITVFESGRVHISRPSGPTGSPACCGSR